MLIKCLVLHKRYSRFVSEMLENFQRKETLCINSIKKERKRRIRRPRDRFFHHGQRKHLTLSMLWKRYIFYSIFCRWVEVVFPCLLISPKTKLSWMVLTETERSDLEIKWDGRRTLYFSQYKWNRSNAHLSILFNTNGWAIVIVCEGVTEG
jgi:hypothetical protein